MKSNKVGKDPVESNPHSMTGYGKSSASSDAVEIEVELRSVNSRFLDINIKAPRVYFEFEGSLRDILQKQLERGRIEVYIQRKAKSSNALSLGFQKAIFDQYLKLFEDLGAQLNCWSEEFKQSAVTQILARKEVLETSDALVSGTAELDTLKQALTAALNQLKEMRSNEGKRLAQDLDERVAHLRNVINAVREESADMPSQLKRRLEERLQLLANDGVLDSARIVMEAALLADRVDITEELVRLESHCVEWDAIRKTGPQGRKLEFILQEMGREFNTVGSKAQKAAIQILVVDAKACLEKMCEQAANIE